MVIKISAKVESCVEGAGIVNKSPATQLIATWLERVPVVCPALIVTVATWVPFFFRGSACVVVGATRHLAIDPLRFSGIVKLLTHAAIKIRSDVDGFPPTPPPIS